MGGHEGLGDFDAARHVKKSAAGGERGVERGKLIRAEIGGLHLKVAAHEAFMFYQGVFERGENDAARDEIGRQYGNRSETVVGESEGCAAREAGGGPSRRVSDNAPGLAAVEFHPGGVAETPELICAFR